MYLDKMTILFLLQMAYKCLKLHLLFNIVIMNLNFIVSSQAGYQQ